MPFDKGVKILFFALPQADVVLAKSEISRALPVVKIHESDKEDDFVESLTSFGPDVILSGSRPGDPDDFPVLRLARKHSGAVPVIILTGSGDAEKAVACMKAGAADCVTREHIGRLGPAVISSLEQKSIMLEKIRTEEMLRNNESMYRLMFTGNPQPMLIYDPESLYILEVNEAIIRHYGYAREEFLSMTIRDIRPAEDVDRLLLYLTGPRDDFASSGIWRHTRKNGDIIFVEIISHSIRYRDKQARHVLIKDITDRKLAEEALRKSEEKYRGFFDNVQDVFFRTDMEGMLLEVSPSVRYYTSRSREELINRPVFELYQDRSDREALLKELREKAEVRDFEVRLKSGKDEFRYTSINARLIREPANGRSYIEGIIRDITERKKAERELHESQERFRAIFENNLSVMLLIDPETGRITDANESAVKYYGWERDHLLTKRIQEINILGRSVRREINKVLSQKQIRFEFRHRRADGSIRDVEVFSCRINIFGKDYLHSIVHDITERKIAETRIRLLSKAVEQSPAGIVIADPGGNIEYVNPKFTAMTGYAAEESIGRNPRFLKSGHHPVTFYAGLWNTIMGGRDWTGEILNRKKNGELYWEEMIISPMVDEAGRIIHFVSIKEDVTERKKMIEELIMAKEKAEESDKLKTAFLHNISHEIRTPLNAIIGFSTFMANPDISAEKRKEFLDIINASNDQLLSIISGIISLATLEAGQEKSQEKETDVNDILLNVYDQFFISRIPPEIIFSYHPSLPESLSLVYTDPVKLTQILVNLVGNALKFTTEGVVRFGYRLVSRDLEFFVEDTGIGIPEDMHEVIFERFRQVDNSTTRKYGGAGLGLALSKGYVELLGGQMKLSSQPGKGSVFTFTIPYRPVLRETPADKGTGKDTAVAIPAGKRILVAEDEYFNYLLIKKHLVSLNLVPCHAENGIGAVRACKEGPAPDLILMDIKMPEMDGIEATRRIREICPGIPVIALTAYALEQDRKHIMESGFDDYIEKPLSLNRLSELLVKFLSGREPS